LAAFICKRGGFAARSSAPIYLEAKREADMPMHRILRRTILGLVLAIGGAQAASSEEYRGTWEQQAACTPDVWRLCGDKIPDVGRIVACLQRNTPNLSRACRAVFETGNGGVAQQQGAPPPRDRDWFAQPGRGGPQRPPPGGYYDDDD
jgi:hypothetical protein